MSHALERAPGAAGWPAFVAGLCFACRRCAAAVLLLLAALAPLPAAAEAYSFGVLPQRSALLTAQYWNPILDHVGRKAGVTLALRVARTGVESSEAAERGEYDFIYSNHIFQPKVAAAGYRVILRTRDEAITGQIVTLAESPVRALQDLAGKEVGFPSRSAFVGYALAYDQLLRQQVAVVPVFGANQEGIMAQLKAGRIVAAGVNGVVMKAYAERERIGYRILWESQPYFNLPVAAHPRVPQAVVAAVAGAFTGLHEDAEGARLLAAAAAVVGQLPPLGFRAATPADYRNYVEFYRNTLIQELK
ncbi:phosphate/phosphite/phosphonate ABC transporter substrate-binding protein [Azospira restricta]|uniref:PhnD/SsuA/transferrin family substrate-binding protein n=1 Tax=Azospira restricta TaxID=404405 RepID=A0A974PYL5_9RHOO|nr:PhnD/SsuA/transferrin family substrate-binding protein [Azospira restricta]QRJ63559.1 PhnD/SsuA/transferrin family substrate-binding protein [Azospira restricta]